MDDHCARRVSVIFLLVSPRAGVHLELLCLLQREIVLPLVSGRLVFEFRVLNATPPTFVAEASTLIVFEFVVPCPWPVTDMDVQRWEFRLGPEVRLITLPSSATVGNYSFDARRARFLLERAMALSPTAKKSDAPRPNLRASWIAECLDRTEDSPRVTRQAECEPRLWVRDEMIGRRVSVQPHTTLLNPTFALQVSRYLPAALQWKTSWRLVYTPRIHGVSMQTFLRHMECEGPSLLVVQDHEGHVFGGFASSPWHIADRYFGCGESFVFKCKERQPKPVVPSLQRLEAFPDDSEPPTDDDIMTLAIKQALETLSEWRQKMSTEHQRVSQVATQQGLVTSPTEALDMCLGDEDFDSWPVGNPGEDRGHACGAAGLCLAFEDDGALHAAADEAKNVGGTQTVKDGLGLQIFGASSSDEPFFLFSNGDCVAMGGGSAFALYLDRDLLHGMSGPCSTFGSEMLSSTENFIINDFECWVFDDP